MSEFVNEERKCNYHRLFKDKNVSEFGLIVIDILSDIFGGIYNMAYHQGIIKRTNWSKEDEVKVNLHVYGLSTYDDNKLTKLVVLCHDNIIRLEIKPSAPRYMKLVFSKRDCREGSMYQRHPTIEEAIQLARENKRNV